VSGKFAREIVHREGFGLLDGGLAAALAGAVQILGLARGI
jgi:hypothetical protein